MIKSVSCAALSVALSQLQKEVLSGEERGTRTVVFCEDRLSLAAERTVCAAVGGTFLTSVYTFSRFLSAERGRAGNILSAQGSAMAIRRIIEENSSRLTLFKKLSAPSAAQAVYDTIALLLSSGVDAKKLGAAAVESGLLAGKISDIALIYEKYSDYLAQNGLEDRNGYLKKLPAVIENSAAIRGARVIFLGFQAFTHTTADCLRAAMATAESVCGIFIAGSEDIYVNEAVTAFSSAAAEYGGCEQLSAADALTGEAEVLRRSLFNPESFYSEPQKTDAVHLFEAADGEEELEFIAASIKRQVIENGIRYAKISVMLPDLAEAEQSLARVFAAYRIPYYADRRMPLAGHPLCAFIFSYMSCVLSGCRPQDTDGVVASPFFPAAREDKDIFRNYSLRLANFRGGVKREPDPAITESFGFDAAAVNRVRKIFLSGLEALAPEGTKSEPFTGILKLLEVMNTAEKLNTLSQNYRDKYPATASFGDRAQDAAVAVISEAARLAPGISFKDAVKILKSGFAAAEISLIPPKADAVFVGDIAATANTGSDVVFAARLTGDVPSSGSDTSLLTDRELTALAGANLDISPKIRQVNLRKRETCALNICAFRKELYLTYPVRLGGEESGPSEIIAYARAVFCTPKGNALVPTDLGKLTDDKNYRALPYYASEKLPALKQLVKVKNALPAATLYSVLAEAGCRAEADAALKIPAKAPIKNAERLYLNYNSLSPTALETYFACPYLGFMRQGLKAEERDEGVIRPLDTGNFIHSVLESLAGELNSVHDSREFAAIAEKKARTRLAEPAYSQLTKTKSGQYTAEELVAETVKISAGMFEQLKNSRFTVIDAEKNCEIRLPGGVKIFGRIDRVDGCGDMVRIIDYKTGTIDATAAKYYTGAKLQLPLYLLSVSGGKRAVGAYYFPASVEFSDKEDGVFRLRGFMDGSDEVVSATDTRVQPKKKSAYCDAYLGGRKVGTAMPPEEFAAFLRYSELVAAQGASEMLSGNVAPSPAAETCKRCKMGGACNFAVGKDGEERESPPVNCAAIAEIAKGKGGNADG